MSASQTQRETVDNDQFQATFTVETTIQSFSTDSEDKTRWLALFYSFQNLLITYNQVLNRPQIAKLIIENAWQNLFTTLTPAQISQHIPPIHAHPTEGFLPPSWFSVVRLPEYASVITEILVNEAWELFYNYGTDNDNCVVSEIFAMEVEIRDGFRIVLGMGEEWEQWERHYWNRSGRKRPQDIEDVMMGIEGMGVTVGEDNNLERLGGRMERLMRS